MIKTMISRTRGNAIVFGIGSCFIAGKRSYSRRQIRNWRKNYGFQRKVGFARVVPVRLCILNRRIESASVLARKIAKPVFISHVLVRMRVHGIRANTLTVFVV